jgi:hypothetical protein
LANSTLAKYFALILVGQTINLLNSYESSPSSGANDKLSVSMNQRTPSVYRCRSPLLLVSGNIVCAEYTWWWPAFTRFFIENSYSKRWSYMYDHAHATCIEHESIGNKVILHFLHEQIRKKEKSEEEDDDPNTLNSNSTQLFKGLENLAFMGRSTPQQQPYFVISKNSGAYKGMGFHIPG